MRGYSFFVSSASTELFSPFPTPLYRFVRADLSLSSLLALSPSFLVPIDISFVDLILLSLLQRIRRSCEPESDFSLSFSHQEVKRCRHFFHPHKTCIHPPVPENGGSRFFFPLFLLSRFSISFSDLSFKQITTVLSCRVGSGSCYFVTFRVFCASLYESYFSGKALLVSSPCDTVFFDWRLVPDCSPL